MGGGVGWGGGGGGGGGGAPGQKRTLCRAARASEAPGVCSKLLCSHKMVCSCVRRNKGLSQQQKSSHDAR